MVHTMCKSVECLPFEGQEPSIFNEKKTNSTYGMWPDIEKGSSRKNIFDTAT